MTTTRRHSTPRVSVVVPVRNGAPQIARCLEGIFNQTLQPYEVIVVDGHSTDSTVEVAGTFPVTVVYEDYGTVGGARQVGVEHARGIMLPSPMLTASPEKTGSKTWSVSLTTASWAWEGDQERR